MRNEGIYMDKTAEQALAGAKILARLDRIPIWPYSKRVMLIVGIGFFFAFYDTLTIGLALPKIQQDFAISVAAATWAVTSSLVGYILGSFIISRIADYFGRHLELILSVGFFSVGSLLSALSSDLTWLIVWRFIAGIGIGAEIVAVTTYMEEMAPKHVRGKATSNAIAFGMAGFAIVPFVALWLVPHFTYGWRILFGSGAVIGIIIFFMRSLLPDSPRWLVLQNCLTEAEEIVASAEKFALNRLKTTLPEPPLLQQPVVLNSDASLSQILQAPYGQRALLFVLMWFIYYIGNYAWLILAPTLFVTEGFTLVKSIMFMALASLGFLVGSWLDTLIGDRIKRKHFSIIIALIWSVTLFVIGWFPSPSIIILFGFIATTTISMLIPLLYIYTGESFPTSIRATSLSITDGLGHLGGAFCGQIIFSLSALISGNPHHFATIFIIMACTGLLTAFLLLFTVDMTKQSLS